MNYKQWVRLLPLNMLISVIAIISINYTIDPLQQFRVSTLYPIHFNSQQQRHLNPGLAKTFDYDSIILGTSHTENFIISEVGSKLNFHKTIKLSIVGGTPYEESQLLKVSLKHQNIKNVLYGLDVLIFSGDENKTSISFPEYLYKDSYINSIVYLLKFDTTIKSFTALIMPYLEYNKNKFKLEYMYNHGGIYGKGNMLKMEGKDYQLTNLEEYTFKVLKSSFENNILHLIKSNKKVNFIIFYPPYSIMDYRRLYKAGILHDVILFKKYIYETLGSLDNVQLYDFQIAQEITHNLDNYSDFTHYNQGITSWILQQIKNNNYRVKKSNIDAYSKNLINQAEKASSQKY